jgi:hypothetical protein
MKSRGFVVLVFGAIVVSTIVLSLVTKAQGSYRWYPSKTASIVELKSPLLVKLDKNLKTELRFVLNRGIETVTVENITENISRLFSDGNLFYFLIIETTVYRDWLMWANNLRAFLGRFIRVEENKGLWRGGVEGWGAFYKEMKIFSGGISAIDQFELYRKELLLQFWVNDIERSSPAVSINEGLLTYDIVRANQTRLPPLQASVSGYAQYSQKSNDKIGLWKAIAHMIIGLFIGGTGIYVMRRDTRITFVNIASATLLIFFGIAESANGIFLGLIWLWPFGVSV